MYKSKIRAVTVLENSIFFPFQILAVFFVCENGVDGLFVPRLILFNCENKTYNSRNLHLQKQGKMFW